MGTSSGSIRGERTPGVTDANQVIWKSIISMLLQETYRHVQEFESPVKDGSLSGTIYRGLGFGEVFWKVGRKIHENSYGIRILKVREIGP